MKKVIFDISPLGSFQFSCETYMVSVDLGSEVDFIAHDLDARVKPLTEELEDDELLINIVERLGDNASWKNSKMRVVELQEC